MSIERFKQASTNRWLHRCRLCVMRYFDINRQSPIDNGFVAIGDNPHLFDDCVIKNIKVGD